MLGVALITGSLFSALKMPRVIGEIGSGIILGPLVLGYFFFEVYQWIFTGVLNQQRIVLIFYWLGLAFLMFTSGIKIAQNKQKGHYVAIILLVVSGTLPPLILGWFFSEMFIGQATANIIAFRLIFVIACSVTSIPVLSRIFTELGLINHSFAKNILLSAAIQDSILWFLLLIALKINENGAQVWIQIWELQGNTLIICILSIFIFFIAPKVINVFLLKFSQYVNNSWLLGLVIAIFLFSASIAGFSGINLVYSTFIIGILIGLIDSTRSRAALKSVQDVSEWFFIPIYFSLVGAQINLQEDFSFLIIFYFLAVTSLIKILSICFVMRLWQLSWCKALDYGVTMNARGGPGIVLASVAYAGGIINSNFFNALIITSLVTSLISGVWLRFRVKTILAEVK